MFIYRASDKLVFNILKSINYGYLEITSIDGDVLKFGNPKHELRARNISKNIRCMICQNQSIDESNAPLAKDLRILIREKIKEGSKDDEIYETYWRLEII